VRNVAKGLVALSALAFVLAAAGAFSAPIMNFAPGTLGRASLGLAVLAIALVVVFEASGPKPGK